MDPGNGPDESESEYTSSSSESEGEDVEDTSLDLFISKSDVEANYKLMDRYFTPTKSPIVLSKLRSTYPQAFTPASEKASSTVLAELSLPFPLSDFQVFSINALLNGQDLLCIMPTGAGKTIVMYIFSLALRKMPGGEGAMVVVGMPLSNIISQQLKSSLCPILTMSMGADITGTSCEASGKASLTSSGGTVKLEEAVNGHFHLLFTHPEALDTPEGQRLLRELSNRRLIRGVIADEVHQGPGVSNIDKKSKLSFFTRFDGTLGILPPRNAA